ncbi:MAG: cation:proton antiporter [Clostridia bacterium]|nr:cation:proton antiporter [Clostridia bacterium]
MLTNDELTKFLLQLTVMLIAAIIFGKIIKRMGQPTIVGELLAGIVLGPTVLKHISPVLFGNMFPNNIIVSSELNCFIQFGMILFMFVSGLKINTKFILNRKKTVLFTSVLGMVIPLLLGVLTVLLIPNALNAPAENNNWIYALFVGIALSISALPVIIKTLTDLNISQLEIGTIIIGSATIDDIVGWTMFACLINISVLNGSILSICVSILEIFLFILVLFTAGVRISRAVFSFIGSYTENTTVNTAITIAMLTLISAIAERIGIHPFFAAFLLGITLKKDFEAKKFLFDTKNVINTIATSFFAPLYFVSVGMRVNLINDFNLLLVLIVLLIAFTGKIVGSTAGALIGGARWKDALVIGVSMNSRGAIEIIVASTAVEVNMIGQQMYVSLIIMAVITSLLSGPIIKAILFRRKSARYSCYM